MSRDAERLDEATGKLREVESHAEREYLHEYNAVLEETGESVRVITPSPDLADNDAATDAFSQANGQWYNANTHPNIVSIVERETIPLPWIAIDQTHDVTLDSVQSQLTPTELETVVTDTAEALRTLGLYNAVHGTLCPDDILTDPDGEDTVVQVRGFGLEDAVQTAVGEFIPTPYTAPELLEDPAQPTDQTDVYGLGAITYFVLTGQPPVADPNLEQAIRDGPTAPPSEYNDEVGSALDDAVMRALSTRPADRQDSPHAFKRAFLSAFDPTAFETPPDPTGQESGSGDDHSEPDASASPEDDTSSDDTKDSADANSSITNFTPVTNKSKVYGGATLLAVSSLLVFVSGLFDIGISTSVTGIIGAVSSLGLAAGSLLLGTSGDGRAV